MFIEFFTGKFITIIGFTAAMLSAFAFYKAAQSEKITAVYDEWLLLGRRTFFVMQAAIVTIGVHLLYLILTHQFQYNYVKHYSDTTLNMFYLVSTFYAGQEGSFMLWMFYGSLFGLFLMRTAREYEAPVMSVLMLSQVFLISMILGIDVPFIGLIGSDPFAIAVGPAPMEGDGLNALLQNPWMVIHPPTLFVGFSSLIVPFSYAVAAMWKKKYDDWVKPAMPWILFSAATLGIGIMMGGYWAYKVLGWGGYWGWDPVENSSLVPWLLIVSLIHCVVVQKKNGGLKKTSLFFAVLSYSMVLYSAFLTRSGVLGDTSVHSFTDLGLYNQLVAYLLTFLLGGSVLLAVRFKSIPVSRANESMYSKEFFLLCGSVVLMMIALVIAAGTSTPLIDKLLGRATTKLEPEFYNKVTLPLAVLIGLFSAIGQLIWWKKIDKETLIKTFSLPVSAALVGTSVLVVAGMRDGSMIVLALTALFSAIANAQIFWKVIQGNPKFAGGSLTHVGLGLMLLGMIGSGKYSETQQIDLPIGQSVEAFGKQLKFTGIEPIDGGAKSGFKIEVTDGGKSFIAMPVMYENARMGTISNPAVEHYLTKDFYVAPQGLSGGITLAKDEVKLLGDYAVKFTGFNVPKDIDANSDKALRIGAFLEITKGGKMEKIEPVFVIEKNREPQMIPASMTGDGIKFMLSEIDATNKRIFITADGLQTLTIEASIKPFIGVLWLGTYIVAAGFALSIYRRWKERKIVKAIAA
ncbi:MAG: cytochrome c biogenesis protein CcsA [Rhizobacter sp.]|nr:cytochrome c biogenesis protein CcsA [Chlorobiales bacterium]